MSAIESLLGPAPEPPPGQSAPTPRTLLLNDDVMIHLLEDESREEVMIYSVPGRMQQAAWLDAREQAWSHSVPIGSHARAVSILSVAPGTRDVFLADVWPRAALDAVTFSEHLTGHARRHRQWRDALRASGDGQANP